MFSLFSGRRHSSRYSHGHGAGEGKDVLCSPPIITHTAATPQGSPNNTLESNLMKDLKDRLTPLMAFHIPGQSFESIDKTSVSFLWVPFYFFKKFWKIVFQDITHLLNDLRIRVKSESWEIFSKISLIIWHLASLIKYLKWLNRESLNWYYS